MIEAVRTCFAKYTDFSGTASRAEFWWFVLFSELISLFAILVDNAANNSTAFFGNATTLALLLPRLAVACRRMHDVGKSGWFMLIPIYNIYLFLKPSQPIDDQL